MYSDRVGRANAYALNGIVSVACLLATPWVMANGQTALLFVVVGVAFWQYGGSLSLMPAFTADFFGSKNLGLNYGLVFLGWGFAFFVPQLAGYIKDAAGSLNPALYLSAGLLSGGIGLSRFLTKPTPPPHLVNRENADAA
jgi:OFA family oxalate/formate antiporter-like MFS transporter